MDSAVYNELYNWPKGDEHNTRLYWHCMSYLNELVVFSDGTVTTCCADSKGVNKLGNCNEERLEDIWRRQITEFHQNNIAKSDAGMPWSSTVCQWCINNNAMSRFGASAISTDHEIDLFRNPRRKYPLSIVIEPTSYCNYRCYGCHSHSGGLGRSQDILSIDTFNHNIVPFLSHVEAKIRFYNYGEPFMHPDCIMLLKLMRQYAPKVSIEIASNAMLMTTKISEALVDNQVNWLVISLHGGHTQEKLLHFAKKGPELAVLKENIATLVQIKRKRGSLLPRVGLKVLLAAWNDDPNEMEDVLLFGRKLGVDFVGWDDIMAEEHNKSRRVAPGTPAYNALRRRKLHVLDYVCSTPAWPAGNEDDVPPVGGLPLDLAGWKDWYDDNTAAPCHLAELPSPGKRCIPEWLQYAAKRVLSGLKKVCNACKRKGIGNV